jgi:hypothetical protein
VADQASVPRRVAIVEHQHVAVGVVEDGHVTDAAVDRVGEEVDALRFELAAGDFDVLDVEGGRVGVGRELPADRGGVDDLEGEVAGLELAAGDFAVVG